MYINFRRLLFRYYVIIMSFERDNLNVNLDVILTCFEYNNDEHGF